MGQDVGCDAAAGMAGFDRLSSQKKVVHSVYSPPVNGMDAYRRVDLRQLISRHWYPADFSHC